MCLDKLRAYTEELIRLDEIGKKENYHTVYELEQGTAIAFDLIRNENGDAFHTFMSKGTIFPLHEHPESGETFILFKGAVAIICEEEGIENHHELKAGLPFHICKCTKHLLSVKEDSWLLAVVIPPDSHIK